MREPVRELAVVAEQQRTGRVGVEPADRDEANLVLGDELDDGAVVTTPAGLWSST